MRFHFISDLHYGLRRVGDESVRALARSLEDVAAGDGLLIGGDLGTGDAEVAACLALFSRFPGPKFAIAGNHDVWVEAGESSWDRYRRLSDILRASGFHPLEDEPAIVGDVGLVGSLGWYDYSFRDDALGIALTHYQQKIYPGWERPLWRDALRVCWGMSDADVTRWQVERLTKHLARLQGVSSVIALLHHVPSKQLLAHPRAMLPPLLRFANAFLGSGALADPLLADARVRLVVSGHIHRAGEHRLGGTRFVSIGGSYHDKQCVTFDPVANALVRTSFGEPKKRIWRKRRLTFGTHAAVTTHSMGSPSPGR